MSSSTASKASIRVLSFLLIIAVLYVIIIPASSKKSDVVVGSNKDHETSRFGIDTSFIKSAGDKITSAVSGTHDVDADVEVDESQQDEEAGLGEADSEAGVEEEQEDELTEEEQAVQKYHQQHGQKQPTRDRPKLPSKPGKAGAASKSNTTAIITETEIPGLRHHTQINSADDAKHLVLVVTRDEKHWGHIDGNKRTFEGFLEFVNDTSGLPLQSISMAILTTTESAYEHYINTMAKYPLAKFQVLLYAPKEHGDEPANRHAPSFQPTRRKQIAIARNVLMLRALGSEEHIFWYDSDVISADKGIAAKMLEHSENEGRFMTNDATLLHGTPLAVGIITARCSAGANNDYDLNAWGHKGSDRAAGRRGMHMKDLTPLTTSDEIFPLDSVGGVMLYIRASLVRQGLNFPAYYAVGTSWENGEGGDGIETEGLCFVAEQFGYGCFGLGGQWHVEHQPWDL